MNRLTTRLVTVVAVLAVSGLSAGCAQGGNVKKAVASLTPSEKVTVAPPTLPPRTRSPRPTAAPPAASPSETLPAEAPAESPSPSLEPSSPRTFPPRTRSPRPTVAPPTTPAVVPAPVPSPSTESLSPSPEPSSPSPTESSPSPAASGSGSSLLWLWILLGAAAIAGVATWLALRSRRRSAAAAGWRSRVVDVYAKGSALHDAMSAAEAPGAQAAADAGARWADMQRRADELAQTLYAMRETAPDETERARVADVLASLQAVRSAMEAERGPGAASVPQAARVHGLLRSFEVSLRALRSPGEYGEPL